MDVITFDLDSTIADTRHRQWMVKLIKSKSHPMTWDDYSLACADDTPIEGAAQLMRQLAYYPIFIITGRSDAARELTQEWLSKHEIPFAGLMMRKAGDPMPIGEFKVQAIEALRQKDFNTVLHVEDWHECAEYIREHAGIPVLEVAPPPIPDAELLKGGV